MSRWPSSKARLIAFILVVAPFLFGALGGATINPKKEIKKVVQGVQASATPAVEETAVGTLRATTDQESVASTITASMMPTAPHVDQPVVTLTPVAMKKPTATPKAVATPSPIPKPSRLYRINNDVLGAYSKEDFTEMIDMYRIHDTDAVKQMVSEGKVVGLRKGALVYLESVDLRDGSAQVKPKGSTTTVWISNQFLD